MSVLRKFLVLFFLLAWLPGLLLAQDEENDFKFYKKYGDTNKQWNESIERGFRAYDIQDCDATLTYLKEAISRQCKDPLLLFKMAACSELLDSMYSSLQYYQLAAEKLPQLKAPHHYQNDIYESYGRALFKAKKYDEALGQLNKALTFNKPNFIVYYMLGSIYVQKKDLKTAVGFFKQALEQNTAQADPASLVPIYLLVAQAEKANKNYPRALELTEKVLAVEAKQAQALQLKTELTQFLQQEQLIKTIEAIRTGGEQKKIPEPATPLPAAEQLPPLETKPSS